MEAIKDPWESSKKISILSDFNSQPTTGTRFIKSLDEDHPKVMNFFEEGQKIRENLKLIEKNRKNDPIWLKNSSIFLKMLEEGKCFYKKKKYKKAIKFFSGAIESEYFKFWNYNQISDALNLRGLSYHALEKYKKAISDYSLSLSYLPNAGTFINRGLSKHLKGELGSAIRDYNNGINLKGLSLYYFYRGLAKKNLHQFESALEDFEIAIAKFDKAEIMENVLTVHEIEQQRLITLDFIINRESDYRKGTPLRNWR